MASPPFSPARVTCFLLVFALALFAVWGLYELLTHATARERMKPTSRLPYCSAPGAPMKV